MDLQDTGNILFGYIVSWERCSQSHSIMYRRENEYKAVNDVYVPFMESKDDEEHRLNTDD